MQWDGTIRHFVFERAPLPVPPWRHPFPTGKASRSRGTPGQVWTGPFPSRWPWPPGLRGQIRPTHLHFLPQHIVQGVCNIGEPLDEPPVMPC